MDMRRLQELDPADWGTGLSVENARICWAEAVAALDHVDRGPVEGRAPRQVLLLASANVFTVPLPWMALLSLRGVKLRVKAARGLGAATRAMAGAFEGVEVQEWRGGEGEALRRALEGVDAVMAFGSGETMAALRQQLPAALPFLSFGPRFSVGMSEKTEPLAAEDLARYDSRGCMSPVGWLTDTPDLDVLEGAMSDAQQKWPRGALTEAEQVAIRGRLALAKMVGRIRVGDGWAVLQLPGQFFSTEALPRLLQVYPADTRSRLDALRLSTVAGSGTLPPAPRHCSPGQMQRPAASRWHDGIDVLACLWGRPFQEWTP